MKIPLQLGHSFGLFCLAVIAIESSTLLTVASARPVHSLTRRGVLDKIGNAGKRIAAAYNKPAYEATHVPEANKQYFRAQLMTGDAVKAGEKIARADTRRTEIYHELDAKDRKLDSTRGKIAKHVPGTLENKFARETKTINRQFNKQTKAFVELNKATRTNRINPQHIDGISEAIHSPPRKTNVVMQHEIAKDKKMFKSHL